MSEPLSAGQNLRGPDETILTVIREGMDVYDANNERIGEVEFVYLGAAGPKAGHRGQGAATVEDIDLTDSTLADVIARAFGDDEPPDVVRKRLLYYGFIRVDRGLLHSDRFVQGDQIASVRDDNVYLNVMKDDLAKD
jgi:hypothetical protein